MKLTFKEIVNREIDKEYEVWRSQHIDITKTKDGDIRIKSVFKEPIIFADDVFTFEREEVSLDEALEALEEGKEIESVASKYIYVKDGKNIFAYDIDGEYMCDFPENASWLKTEEAKGKWYIND